MNYMKGFINLEEQGQLHCEPACQEDTRKIPEIKVSLGRASLVQMR